MTGERFTSPLFYVVGIDTPGADESELQEYDDFYTTIHVPEVLAANPGITAVHRYRLLAPDPRGDLGPEWLALYEMSEEGARGYVERNDGPPERRPRYSAGPKAWEAKRTVWRIIWRRIASVGSSIEPPAALFMVGMDPGPEENEPGEFETFYTSVHLPEVVETGGYRRGLRFGLERAFLHPDPGSPRFCAIYEADESRAEDIAQGRFTPTVPGSQPPGTSGPRAWETRRVAWRLAYRAIH